MNGSAENKAHGASRKPGRSEQNLKLETAQRMLPLVQRIIEDIVACRAALAVLVPEQDRLDRQKRDLTWPERQRRYVVRDEIKSRERSLEESNTELRGLGVTLMDAIKGCVGFPTQVNNRQAFFSWQRGEEGVHFWHFPGEDKRRPIPVSWIKEEAEATTEN
jgi:hypothetical protein